MNLIEDSRRQTDVLRFPGMKLRRKLSLAIRPWLRLVSYAPFQGLRLAGLRVARAKIGKDVVLAPGVAVHSPWRLSIGSHTNIARHVKLDARGYLKIGDNVNVSEEVAVWTAEHDVQSPEFSMTRAAVVIEDRVWVCFRSIILPGVILGEGCVVASGSVVTKNVPPFSIVAGVPARVIGRRNNSLTYILGNL
jgi:acetyltransferase-like isoleucine patch superfamily enzyme